MVYVGQVITDAQGKPQIVESVNGNSYVSRAAQPEELRNRSLPASISPQYNPNSPENLASVAQAPAAEVKVVGAAPAAKDEAAMYAQGYEYKGQENGQQVWIRWEKPRAAGTYTSPAGDTWEIEQANQTITKDGKPIATFFGQDIYYSTYAPSNEGQLPSQQVQQQTKPNPLSSSFVNPFNSNQIITTTYSNEMGLINRANQNIMIAEYQNTPDYMKSLLIAGSPYGFEYTARSIDDFLTGGPFETAEQRAAKKTGMEKFMQEKYLEIRANPDKFGVALQYLSESPGGIALQGLGAGYVFSGASKFVMASESAAKIGIFRGVSVGLGSIYAGEKAGEAIRGLMMEGMPGVYKPAIEATTFVMAAKVGEELYASNVMKNIRGKFYKEEIKVQSPESKSVVVEPNADKSGFVIESESYAIRTRTFLGSIKIRDVVDVSKVRTAGVIESSGDGKSTIKGITDEYHLTPKTGVEDVETSKVIGEVETKDLIDREGLKTSIERLKFLKGNQNTQAAAGFNIMNQDISRAKNKFGMDVLTTESNAGGISIEAKRGKPKPTISINQLETSDLLKTTEMRYPGMKEMDITTSEHLASEKPEWLFGNEAVRKKPKIRIQVENLNDLKSGNIYAKRAEVKGFDLGNAEMKVEQPKTIKGAGMGSSAVSLMGRLEESSAKARQMQRVSPTPKTAEHPTFTWGINPSVSASGYNYADMIKVPKETKSSKASSSKINPLNATNTKAGISGKTSSDIGTFNLNFQGTMQGNSLINPQAQTTTQSQGQSSRSRINRIIKPRGVDNPKPRRTGTPNILIGHTPKMDGSSWKPREIGKGLKIGSEKIAYRKKERLMPSPIQADVSKAMYGKATAPKPTRALLSRATISVPTAEQLKHKTR